MRPKAATTSVAPSSVAGCWPMFAIVPLDDIDTFFFSSFGLDPLLNPRVTALDAEAQLGLSGGIRAWKDATNSSKDTRPSWEISRRRIQAWTLMCEQEGARGGEVVKHWLPYSVDFIHWTGHWHNGGGGSKISVDTSIEYLLYKAMYKVSVYYRTFVCATLPQQLELTLVVCVARWAHQMNQHFSLSSKHDTCRGRRPYNPLTCDR